MTGPNATETIKSLTVRVTLRFVSSCEETLHLTAHDYRTSNMKNRLKRIIYLHTFKGRVIHSISCIMPGFASLVVFVSFFVFWLVFVMIVDKFGIFDRLFLLKIQTLCSTLC